MKDSFEGMHKHNIFKSWKLGLILHHFEAT